MDDKIRDLVTAALEKTARDQLRWTDFNDTSFRAKIGTGYLHVQRGTTQVSHDGVDFYPADTFSIQVADRCGRVVAETEVTEGGEWSRPFAQLFEAARKSALGTDQVIDDMLSSLRSEPLTEVR